MIRPRWQRFNRSGPLLVWRRGELLELHGFGIWHPYFGGHPEVHLIKDRMLGRTMHGQREGYRFDFFEVNPLKVLEKINAKTV